ncbi:MAG TPA: DEAD/DEAH box helicase [Acetobacteraceae bacterium]|nr:DEAD/DEAH box helicase [Acetobacteraceae bacterium]
MPFPPVNPALARALAARDYDEPTPVQTAVLAPEAERRDLLVSAQTGSGKTVAFGLALAPTLLRDEERFGPAGAPLALVIAPTRELAMQVKAELSWLYGQTGARIASCVGGMDVRAEQRALASGCHIVVGTPGRLRDHLERGRLDLGQIRAAVLDEADEMLDMGFRDDLEFILDATPPTRRTLLFSATIPKEIAALARSYQRDSLRIDVGGRNEPHGDIEYRAVLVSPHDAERAAVNVLRYFEARAALVFCATREGVRRLHGRLLERGFDVVALSGELSQQERNRALQSLRDGHSRVCVATDVAARGLDLPELDLVIHADLPTNKETMLHRSGRTGRAGRKGVSVLLVPFARRRRAEQLFAAAGIDAGWSDPPSAELIRARDQDRLLADPLLTEDPAEEELELGQKLLASSTPEQVAAALARLWRAKLPAPEENFDPAPTPRARTAAPQGAGAWFRLAVGRRNNADPKWLIPLICRLGGITKAEIGAIRIFERETRFEVAAEAAGRLAQAVQRSGSHEPKIEPAPPAAPTFRPQRPHAGRPAPRSPW